eukprot:Gb_05591 [translate_table: standard]
MMIYALFAVFTLIFSSTAASSNPPAIPEGNDTISLFDQNYNITWGQYHVKSFAHRRIVQLVLDRSSGSGFASRNKYLFGNFSMQMKLVQGDSSGTVTAFYLTTQESSHHDELDFEFLGNRRGKPYRLQTNVYVDGSGDREERMRLWFDPTADFHTYSVIWNSKQILFLVDDVPIRVFKNLQKTMGVLYPSLKPMQVVASLWNGEDWATEGGKKKINWKLSPFHVSFQGFDIQGCVYAQPNSSSACSSSSWEHFPSKRIRLNEAESLKHVICKRAITCAHCSGDNSGK